MLETRSTGSFVFLRLHVGMLLCPLSLLRNHPAHALRLCALCLPVQAAPRIPITDIHTTAQTPVVTPAMRARVLQLLAAPLRLQHDQPADRFQYFCGLRPIHSTSGSGRAEIPAWAPLLHNEPAPHWTVKKHAYTGTEAWVELEVRHAAGRHTMEPHMLLGRFPAAEGQVMRA